MMSCKQRYKHQQDVDHNQRMHNKYKANIQVTLQANMQVTMHAGSMIHARSNAVDHALHMHVTMQATGASSTVINPRSSHASHCWNVCM